MNIGSQLLDEAQLHLPQEEIEMLRDACDLAKEYYDRKRRPTGEPYVRHVEKVALLLLPFHPDVHTLITALLQYARTKENLAEIKRRFGANVSDNISSLSILEGTGTLSMRTPTQIKRIALALSKDIRVLLIFLHNRWHILENAEKLPRKEQILLARETITVLAPICARLGIYSLKYSLETLAFITLYPEEASDVWKKLTDLRQKHGSCMSESQQILDGLLKKEGVKAHSYTREKHPYSIFHKLQSKGLSNVTDIYDLFGMRVLVESVEECYQVLGIIHRTYRPLTHRIKDYIAMPKPNGYRSLHTTVLGVSNHDPSFPVEIQIRTYEMDEEAEYGVAAHWNYKEHTAEDPIVSKAWQDRMKALQQLSEAVESEKHEDFQEEVSDRIYVLTPKGEPIELPKGATPLDFAFRIHTDIGLRFRNAKVNGAIASIDQELENGDQVEILTWNEPRPSPEWIKLVNTKEARTKVRSYFGSKEEKHEEEKEIDPTQLRHSIPKVPKQSTLQLQTYGVQLETDTTLPFRFAHCCSPQKHNLQRPPVVGIIGRAGIVTVHWSGCRMLQDANPERFVRAKWVAVEKPTAKIPKLFSRLRKRITVR